MDVQGYKKRQNMDGLLRHGLYLMCTQCDAHAQIMSANYLHQTSVLCVGQAKATCTQYTGNTENTVKPVYSDHAISWTSLVIMDRWSLYTGKLYRENARGSTRTSGC
jgi:hypothetical protein